MKTILVDAIHTFVSPDGAVSQDMFRLLETFPNRKIVLTLADDEEMKRFGLDKVSYEVFSSKHNPPKTDPEYYRTMLAHFGLKADEVVYFEHDPAAVQSAAAVGINSYYYDSEKRDLEGLSQFLNKSL